MKKIFFFIIFVLILFIPQNNYALDYESSVSPRAIVGEVIPSDEVLSLDKQLSFRSFPFDDVAEIGYLSPQNVYSFEKWTDATNKTWYHIKTWMGNMWITGIDPTYYLLETSRWNMKTDGNNPVETTKGFNDALKWASQNGKTTFKVPAGTYLIAKSANLNDSTAQINMVSNMTFWLDDNAVLQKETNGWEGYTLLYVGQEVKNVTLKGGTYRGDKDTHDYSGKDYSWSYGTHESGTGIMLAGPDNVVVDGVKSTNFTGDALCICGNNKQVSIAYDQDFESGSIDDNGNLVADPTKVRTNNNKVTSLSDPVFKISNMFGPTLQVGREQTMPLHVYFYKSDGTFISSVKDQELMWSLITVPEEASYFKAVLETTDTAGIQFMIWNRAVTRNSVIKNSEFSFSRRQGITVAGADNVVITNNNIHDIKGTAPESGIDLEGGTGQYGNRNTNLIIKSNKIYNNNSYNVILYDGQDVTVEDNYLGPNETKSSVGVAVSSPFRTGAIIKNNIIEGSKIANENEATYIGNQVNGTMASITGHGIIIDGMILTNATLWLQPDLPYGITPSNITLNNTDGSGGRFLVDNQPLHVTNLTITGKSTLPGLGGNAPDGSTFDHVKVLAYGGGIALPRGTYTHCVFEAAAESDVPPSISGTGGTWVIDGCNIKTKKNAALSVDNPSANVTIKNSTMDVSGTMFGNQAVILVKKAGQINILNNSLNALGLTQSYIAAIKINITGEAMNPATVLRATIKGNTITTNNNAKGISTIDAGTGAPVYDIQDNILYNAQLDLKTNDINMNNKQLLK
ncbi:right-handed parallel beta-helix repeat-containing protein [Paenibacillus sp. FSL H8-0034]|uniref:right-handed parallel beta-helix repeat-containing protein n=1 Tax=Paenibacillus sp. FSL H8-0034 TaxID=2954671 RepID=UPI0030F73A59